MDTEAISGALFVLGGILGGWEIILILAVVLILFGARNLPGFARGMGRGLEEFGKAANRELRSLAESGSEGSTKESGLVYEALTHDSRTVDFVYPHEVPDLDPNPIVFVAQGFGIGRIPFAPGFFGSLIGIAWFLLLLLPGNFWFYLAGTILGLAASVWICGSAEKILKQKDPPSVVLDEIAAMPVCFLAWVARDWMHRGSVPGPESFFTSGALPYTILVFALFRLLDVVKPWPLASSQRLPGGWGITVDDVLAALYVAALSLLLIP